MLGLASAGETIRRTCGPACSARFWARWHGSPPEPEVTSMGELLELVHARDGGLCGICAQPVDLEGSCRRADGPTLDHVVAVSLGGGDEMANLQAAHRGCNSRKGKLGRG